VQQLAAVDESILQQLEPHFAKKTSLHDAVNLARKIMSVFDG
jgi:hypothetical protein